MDHPTGERKGRGEDAADKPCCPKCGSERWMTGLPLYLPVEGFAAIVRRPSFTEKPVGYTGFTSSICGACGYTEFHATDHKAVWDEWRKQNA